MLGLEITLSKANDEICDLYAEGIKGNVDDLLTGDLDGNFFEHYKGMRNRVTEGLKITSYDKRVQLWNEIALQYFDLYEPILLERGFTQIVINYPGTEKGMFFGTVLGEN